MALAGPEVGEKWSGMSRKFACTVSRTLGRNYTVWFNSKKRCKTALILALFIMYVTQPLFVRPIKICIVGWPRRWH